MNALEKLLQLVAELEQHKLAYRLLVARPEAVMVEVAVPGERWEVEFFADGNIEVEVFRSDGIIAGEDSLSSLFEEHGQ